LWRLYPVFFPKRKEAALIYVSTSEPDGTSSHERSAIVTVQTSSTTSDPAAERSINCRQLLNERLQVQWELQGDMVQIQLAARMREDQYMAFGLSGEQGRSYMIGGDVVVAFYDSERGTFRVEDYYMTATAQVQYFLYKSLHNPRHKTV
jgi:hypothetical protein